MKTTFHPARIAPPTGAFIVLALAATLAGAAELLVEIAPNFGGAALQPGEINHSLSSGEKISVTRLSYLVSGFALEKISGSWTELPGQFAWLDATTRRDAFMLQNIPTGQYRALRFAVGLDPGADLGDPAQHPAEHPLNPNLNGLHWSWQSGYIFLALEGHFLNGSEPARGYSYHFARGPNRTVITLPIQLDAANSAAASLKLTFDLAALLNAPRPVSPARDGETTHSRPGDPIAAALKANLPGAFQVRQIIANTRAAAATPPPKPLYLPAKFTPHRFTMSTAFPVPDLPRDNPLLEERVALGHALFHEKKLSRDNSLACASCHAASAAFSDSRRYSLGVAGRVGTRQAMPLFNLAWKNSFFWDGRAPSLRAQALMPIQDHVEMDEKLERVVAKLSAAEKGNAALPLTPASPPGERKKSSKRGENPTIVQVSPRPSARLPLPGGEGRGEGKEGGLASMASELVRNPQPGYSALFAAAFGSPEITSEKIALALENFLLTLTSHGSKFDRAMRGAAELTEEEKRGFELFVTEADPRRGQFGADCFHCHGGALFTDNQFHNNGLPLNETDEGRSKVTGLESDRGKFSTPSLRNVALTAPYMHDGRFATLEEVVEHYHRGIVPGPTLDPNLAKHSSGGVPIGPEERRALVAFLKTLTDEKYSAKPAATTKNQITDTTAKKQTP